uniref:Phorbol-ester/DAG-type domain-containing protein n=1 Tax=Leptobrachium leishanense TaxID=445787 RepID=A0A8C5MAZ2_9ANUR
MIPENNAVEESMEKESELRSPNQPHSSASTGSQESKLQKLKKSLSFKTKSIRSKSAENFFQRTSSDMKIDLCSEESLISSGKIHTSESQPSTPSKAAQQLDNKTHIFQEHMFKKPTFCDVCNHMIVGANTKYGLRCKACKMSIHHRCADSTGFQRCMGKLPKGFRRYYSSPLLINEQFGCIKEVMPIAYLPSVNDEDGSRTMMIPLAYSNIKYTPAQDGGVRSTLEIILERRSQEGACAKWPVCKTPSEYQHGTQKTTRRMRKMAAHTGQESGLIRDMSG